MAFLTPLSLDEARELGAAYGLEVLALEPVAGGSVNSNFRLETSGGRFFARVYEEQTPAGAERELRLLRELAAEGVPTTVPPARLDGAALGQHRGKPLALYPWVEGEVLCTELATPERCRRVGTALAEVHLATPRLSEVAPGRFEPAQLQTRLGQVRREGSPELVAAADEVQRLLDHWLPQRDPALPAGLVHGDLFRDNVLWRGLEIAALIDFESAARGVFVYDLAVTLLAWCFRSEFEAARLHAMLQGYLAARALSPAERAGLDVEAAFACLRFATTRLTDYSLRAPAGQPPLRDYRRFLARLRAVEAGALRRALEGVNC